MNLDKCTKPQLIAEIELYEIGNENMRTTFNNKEKAHKKETDRLKVEVYDAKASARKILEEWLAWGRAEGIPGWTMIEERLQEETR